MARKLTLNDNKALSFLAEDPQGHLTFRIAHACGLVERREHTQAYTMLRRLERWGYVQRRSNGGGFYAFWTITDAGRKAVEP